MRAGVGVLLALGAGFSAGCRHSAAHELAPAVGAASYVILSEPEVAPTKAAARRSRGDNDADTAETVVGEYFQAPRPRDGLAAPRYPRELLGPSARAVVVTVRVNIDAAGAVQEVTTSPTSFSTAGRDAALFLRAVREAAKSWRFEPAVVLHVTPPAERGALPGLRSERVESHLDLQFTFVP